MATENRNYYTQRKLTETHYQSNPKIGPYVYVYDRRGQEEAMTRVSFNTRNFHNTPAGDLPMNSFQFTKVTTTGLTGAFTSYSIYGGYSTYTGCVENTFLSMPSNTAFSIIPAALKSQCVREARNKVLLNAKDMKINIAQAFAERKQLADMIANTALRLANAMRNLKKGDFGAAAENLGVKASRKARQRHGRGFRRNQQQAIANGWLELQYGWRPLLGDIHGAAEAIAQARYGTPKFKAQATCRRQEIKVEKIPQGSNNTTVGYTDIIESRYECKLVVYFKPHSSLLQWGSGLGLTNPALIAWELMPYSFVVDWFLPVGDWLSAMDATVGLDFVKGSQTEFTRSTRKRTVTGTYKRQYDTVVCSAYGSQETVECYRYPMNSWPLPALPAFKNPVSPTHALNALALLTQLFRK